MTAIHYSQVVILTAIFLLRLLEPGGMGHFAPGENGQFQPKEKG